MERLPPALTPSLEEDPPDDSTVLREAKSDPSPPTDRVEPALLSGWVFHGGLPVVGARVDLASTRAPGDCVESSSGAPADWPFTILGSVEPAANDDATDESGAFRVAIPCDGWFGLRIEADGFPRTLRGPFRLERAGVEPLRIELEPAGAIEGRVRIAEGESGLGLSIAASNGWGFATTAALASDGSFRITDLAPGSYQVRAWTAPSGTLRISGGNPCAGATVWDCVVGSGTTTRMESECLPAGSVVLVGRFVLEGRKPRTLWASLCETLPGAEVVRAQSPLDEEGNFRLAVSRAGRFSMRIGDHSGSLRTEVVLSPGENPWNVRLQSGTLRVHFRDGVFLDEAGIPRELRLVQELGRTEFEVHKRFHLEDWEVVVPAGRARLEARNSLDAPEWVLIQELEVRAGEETWVDL